MVPDVAAFVATCTVCAWNQNPRQASAGLLQPLPIPHHPCSHISLDFVTVSPILTVVDRFSKAVHFIPLPKLPSSKVTAQLMMQHVLQIHELPVDMVSDCGPHFSSRSWKAFCTLIGSSGQPVLRVPPPV